MRSGLVNPKPRRIDGLDVNRVSDGYVIYRPTSEVVHYLNLTGAFIFELCDGETPVEWMADLVREAFELEDPPTDEVSTCLSDLYGASLIE